MKTILLIRHGEALHHIQNMTGGWSDVPLTDKGVEQARRVGQKLQELVEGEPVAILSSDLIRAKQTAQEIERFLKVPPRYYAELRELNNGVAKGLSREQAKRIENPMTDPVLDWVPYQDAESWWDMVCRVACFLDQEVEKFSEKRLVVVSHGNAMVAIALWWFGLHRSREAAEKFMLYFDPASITILKENEYERYIEKSNDTSHLTA